MTKRSTRNTVRKMSTLAMLIAAGILLQLAEMFFPIVMIVPGYKLGLANIISLYALYAFGPREMVEVMALRILLAGLASGSLFNVGFFLSLSGGLLAMAAMFLAYKSGKFSIYGVSVAGAAAHSAGQVLAVSLLYQQYFMQLWLPVLLALSILSGLAVAMLCQVLLKRLDKPAYRRSL